MIPLSINNPRAMIIPVIEVIWRGSPMNLQPTITKQIEKGRMRVTMTADLIPRKNKLRLKTKKK